MGTPYRVWNAVRKNCAGIVSVPVLRLLDSDTLYVGVCPDCGKEIRIFGESHVDEAAEALNLKVLGKVPVDPAYAEAADKGEFHTVKNPYLEVEFE